jgi:radical SAM protein with 4Fe4S-binding SPASM domain
LSADRWDDIAAQAAEMQVVGALFGGGEPLMRPDLPHICDSFARRGIRITLTTKALIVPSFADHLAKLGVKCAQVSIDAPDAELADGLTQTPGYFRQAIASILNLREAGIKVRTNSVLTSINIGDAARLIRYLAELGVSHIQLSPYGRSAWVPDPDRLFISPEDRAGLKNTVRLLSNEYPHVKIGLSGAPPPVPDEPGERRAQYLRRPVCGAGRELLIIHSDGKASLCGMLPAAAPYVVGDLSSQTLAEVWESPLVDELLHPSRDLFAGTACSDCADFDPCHEKGRCFRNAFLSYGSFHVPAPDCPRAPPGKRLS